MYNYILFVWSVTEIVWRLIGLNEPMIAIDHKKATPPPPNNKKMSICGFRDVALMCRSIDEYLN